jgi:hypothetical protein
MRTRHTARRAMHREIRERVAGKGVMRRLFGSGCLTFYCVAKMLLFPPALVVVSQSERKEQESGDSGTGSPV